MASFDFTAVSLLWVGFILAALGLAAVILKARPISRGNVILVALLVQQVASVSANVFLATATETELKIKAFSFTNPTLLLWSPIVFLAGPLLLGKAPRARVFLMIGALAALPSLVTLALYYAAPRLVTEFAGVFLNKAGIAVALLVFVGFAFTVGVLAWEALRTPFPVRRGQFALLAAAFSVEGVYHAAQSTAKLAVGLDFYGVLNPTLTIKVIGLAPVILYVALAGWAGTVMWKDADADRRKWARMLVGFLLASAATGVVTAPLASGEEFRDPTGAFHAFWDLAALALLVYAGMRYQLFSLERIAKRSVAITSAIMLAFISFNVLQELAEQVISSTRAFAGLPAPSIVAAVMVATAGVPLERVGRRFAGQLFPNVKPTVDYEHQRKVQIYTAALEGALADGIKTPRETTSLKRLRAELKIDEAEHDRIEAEVRASLEAGTPAAAAA